MMNLTVETYILILLIVGALCLLLGLLLHFKDDKAEPYNSELKKEYHSPTKRADSLPDITGDVGLENKSATFHRFDRPDEQINVRSNKLDLTFLKEDVCLYFDHNTDNVYTGEENTSEITAISHIKRVGLGSLAYDGSSFKFIHNDHMQIFKINQLDYIALYPNCFVIVSRKEVPTALFFMNETEGIRELLNVV